MSLAEVPRRGASVVGRIKDTLCAGFPRIILFLLLSYEPVLALQIERLEMPEAIESGHHHDSVVLDCVYSYNITRDKDLVVKWFRNQETTPLYQWIPALNTRLFHHSYKNYLDEMYKHNDNDLEKFRAIRIKHPVRELSGLYSCEVISQEDEKQKSQHLYIYDKPYSFDLRVNSSGLSITCTASVTEPDAVLSLYRIDYDATESVVNKIKLNATLRSLDDFIEARSDLMKGDTQVKESGASRLFLCELNFRQIPMVTLQRAIQIVNEQFSDDPEALPLTWSTSSRPNVAFVILLCITCSVMYTLYL